MIWGVDRRLRRLHQGQASPRPPGGRGRPRRRPQRRRDVRVDRPPRADPQRVRRRGRRVRAAPPGHRGCRHRPPALQARALRRLPLPGVQDRPLRRRGRGHRVRRDPAVRRRGLRHHRAPRPGQRPVARAPRAGGARRQARPLPPGPHELEEQPQRVAHGPIAVVPAILDAVVDDYRPVLDGLDQDIVEIEAQVFSPERVNPAERIYKLKRQVLALSRNVEPLLEPLERLQANANRHEFGPVDLGPYFRDVYDHLQREVARIAIQRELLSEVLSVNLTHISVQQNDDMRRISGWAAIALVPTMLAGLWGMNFEHMPELDKWWGYPLALTIMFGTAFLLWRWLRSRGWL